MSGVYSSATLVQEHPSTQEKSKASGSVALVIAAALGLSSGFTALFVGTTGVFLLPIAQTLGVGRGAAASCVISASLGLAISSPIAGRLVDRYGFRKVISVSILLFVLGLLSLSVGPYNVTALSIKTFLIGLLGVATSPVGYLPILARSFERRLGLALGIASVGAGIGAAVAPLVAGGLIQRHGWQFTYMVLAATAAVLGALATYLIYRFGGSAAEPAVKPSARDEAVLPGMTARESLAHPRFWVMSISIALVAAVGLGGMVHIPAMLKDNGLSVELAAAGSSFAAIGITCGRLLAGVLLDLITARVLSAILFLLGALGVLILATVSHSTPYPLLGLGAALTGMLIGAEGDLMPFLVKRYFGLRSFGMVYGLMISIFAIGTLLGPILFGAAFDRLGNYHLAMEVAIVACVVGAIGILTVGSYRYASDQRAERPS
ncbi:MAG TPA: MFS transporter [Bordetella sp.]